MPGHPWAFSIAYIYNMCYKVGRFSSLFCYFFGSRAMNDFVCEWNSGGNGDAGVTDPSAEETRTDLPVVAGRPVDPNAETKRLQAVLPESLG